MTFVRPTHARAVRARVRATWKPRADIAASLSQATRGPRSPAHRASAAGLGAMGAASGHTGGRLGSRPGPRREHAVHPPRLLAPAMGASRRLVQIAHRPQQFRLRAATGTLVFIYRHRQWSPKSWSRGAGRPIRMHLFSRGSQSAENRAVTARGRGVSRPPWIRYILPAIVRTAA